MENEKKFATSNTEKMVISCAEYESLVAENKWLAEQLRLLQKKVFGVSSEKTPHKAMDGQMAFEFNEAESYTEIQKSETKETSVEAHTRRTRSGAVRDILPDNIPVEVEEHRLPEAELVCPECGQQLVEIGKEIHQKLKIIPAKVILHEDHYYTYACATCKETAENTPVVNTPKVPAVIPGSYASPEAIAHIMTQKFVMGSPLYRQEQELNRAGIMLSRQTMSNWILRAADDWLRPIYEYLRKELCQRQVLHADETTLQVLHEDGKPAQSKSYMWLYRTSGDAEHPIVLYEYRPNRKAANVEHFLEGFSGYLHADGYAGYHTLRQDIRVVGCLAHARRKFDEAVKALAKQEQATAAAHVGLNYCTELFTIEKSLADLTPEERYTQRLEREKPVLDALLAWSHSIKAAPKSALGKAIYYLHQQWPYLIRYLEDGRLEISNNRAERSIKPFVTGRKNFLFANTANGAQGSAVMYSLIETAKENKLDPYRYLVWVMTMAPALATEDPNWAAKLMPDKAPNEVNVNS